MELLATLDLGATNAFFDTFFRLPDFYWRGFLSSSLSSAQLIVFALLTYALAPVGIKWALMRHLVTSPAGGYLLRAYLGDFPSHSPSFLRPVAMNRECCELTWCHMAFKFYFIFTYQRADTQSWVPLTASRTQAKHTECGSI